MVGSRGAGPVCCARITLVHLLTMCSIVNLGTYGGSLVTGEPMNNELLPCEDAQWDSGAISYNGPLFGPNLAGVDVGHWAQTCQAAHMLGRVQRHRTDDQLDPSFRLTEASQLNRTLAAFDSMTQGPTMTPGTEYSDNAIAICCSARFLLYEGYACNERYDGFPTGQEAEIQKMSLYGIEECVERMYQLALRLRHDLSNDMHKGSILVIHALYWAASECRWYVKEEKTGAGAVLETILDATRLLNRRWRRAGKCLATGQLGLLTRGTGDYLKLLEREESMED